MRVETWTVVRQLRPRCIRVHAWPEKRSRHVGVRSVSKPPPRITLSSRNLILYTIYMLVKWIAAFQLIFSVLKKVHYENTYGVASWNCIRLNCSHEKCIHFYVLEILVVPHKIIRNGRQTFRSDVRKYQFLKSESQQRKGLQVRRLCG